MAQPDFAKINRNLERLYKGGATDDEVGAYLGAEQVTPQQVAEWQDSQKGGIVSNVVNAVASVPGAIYETVVGRQDPEYADIAKQPSIEKASGIVDPQAEMFGVSDAAYGDIYKRNLGDRYIGSFKDKEGYEIVRFRGKDGAEQQAYVNKPGLDWQDVNRGIGQAMPYLAAGTVAGRALGGAGAAANVVGQGVAAMGASGAMDAVGAWLGSKQGLDFNRMLVSGAMGAGGEALGRVVMPFLRKNIQNRTLVGSDGTLTRRGRKLAEKQGLNPDDLNGEIASILKNKAALAEDPGEAIIQSTTDRFGIPTTRGQRTKDPQMLVDEDRMRYGKYGGRAKQEMQTFDLEQRKAIERAAIGEQPGEGIAGLINPARAPSDLTDDAIGEQVLRGAQRAQKNANLEIRKAWRGTENIEAVPAAYRELETFVTRALDDVRVAPTTHPTAVEMDRALGQFVKRQGGQKLAGEPPKAVGMEPKFSVIKQEDVRYIDEMRRTLMKMKDGAVTGADREAARRIYEGFDDWMKSASERQLLTGSPDAAQKILDARKTTAQLKGLFDPRKRGKTTAAGRILNKLGDAETGEEALRALLGSSGPQVPIRDGGVKALRQFKTAALKYGGDEGKRAWDDVRLSFWLKMVRNPKGEMATPTVISNNIQSALQKNPTLIRTLYTGDEVKLMRQFQQSMKAASYKDPQPSKSGIVMSPMADAAKTVLKGQGERERFVKGNILLANIYRQLARMVPDAAGMQDLMGAPLARSATSQTVKRARPPAMGGYAAAAAPSLDRMTESRTGQFSPNRMLGN